MLRLMPAAGGEVQLPAKPVGGQGNNECALLVSGREQNCICELQVDASITASKGQSR
jgi:hypothetical protein